MWETQKADNKDTPLARHSRKRGGGFCFRDTIFEQNALKGHPISYQTNDAEQ